MAVGGNRRGHLFASEPFFTCDMNIFWIDNFRPHPKYSDLSSSCPQLLGSRSYSGLMMQLCGGIARPNVQVNALDEQFDIIVATCKTIDLVLHTSETIMPKTNHLTI
jgi:hypothetical protein